MPNNTNNWIIFYSHIRGAKKGRHGCRRRSVHISMPIAHAYLIVIYCRLNDHFYLQLQDYMVNMKLTSWHTENVFGRMRFSSERHFTNNIFCVHYAESVLNKRKLTWIILLFEPQEKSISKRWMGDRWCNILDQLGITSTQNGQSYLSEQSLAEYYALIINQIYRFEREYCISLQTARQNI